MALYNCSNPDTLRYRDNSAFSFQFADKLLKTKPH